MTAESIRLLFQRVMAGDTSAADEVEALANRLKAIAEQLRFRAGSIVGVSGVSDRVQIRVVGPTGEVKQTADTGKVP